jgi:hypothetical protein
MSDISQSNERITSLGVTYWEAAWRLMEKCNESSTEIPQIKIPLFAALILAEGGEDKELKELTIAAKESVLVSIKQLLDLFMEVEKVQSKKYAQHK